MMNSEKTNDELPQCLILMVLSQNLSNRAFINKDYLKVTVIHKIVFSMTGMFFIRTLKNFAISGGYCNVYVTFL